MHMVSIIILLLGAALGIIYVCRYPFSTLSLIMIDRRYRILKNLRRLYLQGIRREPPNSYQNFHIQAIERVGTYDSHLLKMLEKESFIVYYFTKFKDFSGEVYHSMWEDYRTGSYLTRDCSLLEHMKKILPAKIASSPRAVLEFSKIAEAGWFDKETGMYNEQHQKQDIGRAIYLICKRNGISSPQKIFADFWGVKESKVKDWMRTNENETITEKIDSQVKFILESH